MAQSKAIGGLGAIERRLLEVLGDRFGLDDARRLLRQALSQAGIAAAPDDQAGLAMFVCGALCDVIERAHGRPSAVALVQVLEPLYTRSSEAKSSGVQRQTPKLTRARVLVMAKDPPLDALQECVGRLAKLEPVRESFSLLAAVDDHREGPLVILVGPGAPTLEGPMLETLERCAPAGLELVFWGASPPETELRVTALNADADVEEVAACCVHPPPALAEPPRIVLADDDASWRSVLERGLRRAGYAVTACEDGLEALEACIEARPALVITDLEMPTINGRQLAALLATRFAPSPPPVLMVTASATEEVEHVETIIAKGERLAAVLSEVRSRLPLPNEE